eukprot:366991_1
MSVFNAILNHIDSKTKHLIYGYNRSLTKMLSDYSLFDHTPISINTLCLLYYFIHEHFPSETAAYGTSISFQDKKVTKTDNVTYEKPHNKSFGFEKILSTLPIQCVW